MANFVTKYTVAVIMHQCNHDVFIVTIGDNIKRETELNRGIFCPNCMSFVRYVREKKKILNCNRIIYDLAKLLIKIFQKFNH